MSNATAAATLLRRLKKPCRASNQRMLTVVASASKSGNRLIQHPTGIFRSAILSSPSFPICLVTPLVISEATTSFHNSKGFRYEQFEMTWRQLAVGMGFAMMMATTTTTFTCCENDVVLDPPVVDATKQKEAENKETSAKDGEAEEGVSEPVTEKTQQRQQAQFDANLLTRISKKAVQMERWLGELARDPDTLKKYQEFQAKQQVSSIDPRRDVVVDNTMTKPDILWQVAQLLIDLEGWGSIADLVPLVVQHLEVAGLQKYTKDDMVAFYHILRLDSLMLQETGPCLPIFRALHECFMMQPSDANVTAKIGPIEQWTSRAMAQVCPLHVDLMTQCLNENQNMVQLVRHQKEFEAIQQGILLPWMMSKADKIEWTRPPFTLDYTPWKDYVQVRGWNVQDVEKRLQEEQQWRNDTFFGNSSTTATRRRGQPYWEQVQYEWNDVPVITLQVDVPRVDPATGYRLIKAWACDANMPQPHIGLPSQPEESKDDEQVAGEPQPPPLILGLCDGNPTDNRRRRGKETVPLPVSVLAARTEAIQIYALYAEYKTTMRADKARLYHTAPLSLVSPLIK